VKKLKLTKKAQETKSLKVSSLKRLTRYSNYLYSIHIGSPYNEDLSLLMKIQYKIRHIQALKLNKKDLAETHADNGLKKLLIRFKNLKSYKNEAEDSSNLQNLRDFMNQGLGNYFNHYNFAQMRQKIPLKFHTKKKNDQKTQRLIYGMRKHLSFLAFVEDNQNSFTFAVNLSFDREEEDSDREILGLIRRQRTLDYPKLSRSLKAGTDGVHKIVPFLEGNGLNVISQGELNEILNEGIAIERFLSERNSRVYLDSASKCLWEKFLLRLSFQQQKLFFKNSCVDLSEFVFYFHSPFEVKNALVNNFKRMKRKVERVIFSFKANSLDWFQEDERSCLRKMMNELCKEKKCSEIEWNVSFTTAFEKELVTKAKNEIFSVIKNLVLCQQKAKILTKYVLKINFDGGNDENLLLFLDLFQQIPNAISILKLNLFSEEFNHLKWSKQNSKDDSMNLLIKRAGKIKDYVMKLQKNDSFKSVVIPQLDEFEKKIGNRKEKRNRNEII